MRLTRVAPRSEASGTGPDTGGRERPSDPLDAARQLGDSLDVLVRDFVKGVKDLIGI